MCIIRGRELTGDEKRSIKNGFKVFLVEEYGERCLHGPYYNQYNYNPRTWNKAEMNGDRRDCGFYVFLSEDDAKVLMQHKQHALMYPTKYAVKKVKVKGVFQIGDPFGMTCDGKMTGKVIRCTHVKILPD